MRSYKTIKKYNQVGKSSSGNVTQAGRDNIQVSTKKFSIWISIILIAILAVSSPFWLRIFGENFPSIDGWFEQELREETVR